VWPSIALAVLAFGVPVALFVLWPLFAQRDKETTRPADEVRTALEAEKVLALRAIRDLTFDHEAGHMTDWDFRELRARHEARASAILKRLDDLGPPPPGSAPARRAEAAAPVPWSRQPVVLGAAGGGLLVFGVVLGVLVMRFTGPAPADSSGSPMAGMPRPGETTEPPAPGNREAPTAEGAPRPIPKAMLEGMLQAAHASLDAGRYQEAIAAYKAVLKREPTNVDAITHLGVILGLAGHADGALDAFDRALAISPDYPHALWDKARVLYELKRDYAGAIAAWERFVKVSPAGEDRDRAFARIREAKSRLAGASSR